MFVNRAAHNFQYGVPGAYHIIKSYRVQVGPILNRDEYGRVLVEVLKGHNSSVGFNYKTGAQVWLPSSRITWNKGVSS